MSWSKCNSAGSDHSTDDTNVYTCSSNMQWSYLVTTSNDIEQWDNGIMESCIEQYSNDDIHLYTNGRTVCHDNDPYHNGEPEHYTNLYTCSSYMQRSHL